MRVATSDPATAFLGDFIVEESTRVGDSSIPVLSVTNSNGFTEQTNQFSKKVHSEDISSYKVVLENQFAFNPSRVNVGSIDRLKGIEAGALSPMYVVFSVDESRLSPEYLEYFIRTHSFLQQVKQNTSGTVRNSLSFKSLSGFKLNVPSLSTQRRIIEELHKVDAVINLSFEEVNEGEKLKKGLLQDLFSKGAGHTQYKNSELGEIPEHWEVRELSEVADVERGKFGHRPRNDPAFYGGDIPFIQTGDVVNTRARISSYSQTLNEKGLAVSRMFPRGTIVMTIAANIGATSILDIDACFPDSLVGITPNPDVDVEYLEYYLQTQVNYLNSIATQSAQKNINLQKLNPLKIAVPPPNEQLEIASLLKLVDKKISVDKQIKYEQEKLKRGLMQDLLSGKVAV